MSRQCFVAHICGRVQGVSFRYYTQRQAEQLGIDGWVRNMPDGSVQACICGEPEAVATMRGWLAHGPAYASVSSIEFTEAEPAVAGRGFIVR